MYVVFRTPFNKEYIIDVIGDELISECRQILQNDYQIEPDSYFLSIEPSFDHLNDNCTLRELGIDSGHVISMGYSEEFIKKTKKLEKKPHSTRVLLNPYTTKAYIDSIPKDKLADMLIQENSQEEIHEEIIDFDPSKDPSNIKNLVRQIMETGATKNSALRALRKTNYNFVDACLLLEKENSGEYQTKVAQASRQPNKPPNSSDDNLKIPKSLLEGLTPAEQASLEKLVKKYRDVQIVYDVFMVCNKVESSCNSILSEYLTPE
jgi:NACalpha-BTF3-like transcription factor